MPQEPCVRYELVDEPRIVRDRLPWVAPSGHRVEIGMEKLFEGIGT